MKRLVRCMGQARSLLPVLALLLSLPKTAFPLFFAYGRCFNYDGTSGTASDAPSYASLAVYRHGIDSQVGRQNDSGNPYSDEALYQASGGLPAYFLSDVDTPGQWNTAPALGQTAVAVLECRPGQFGWTGPAMQAWSRHVLGPADLGASTADMGSFTLQPLPLPSALPWGPSGVELTWSAPADPLGLISSYTVYRASFPAPAPQYRYSKTWALPNTAKIVGGQVSFTDNPPPGPLWRYRVAANFIWEPGMEGDDFDAGAIPDKDYYVAFGQSEEALAPGPPAPTATLTPPKPNKPHGRPRLGPVPARRGALLCLDLPGQASRAGIELYTLGGEAAARCGAESRPCLATAAFAPGIYLARIVLALESGGQEIHWQKIALIP